MSSIIINKQIAPETDTTIAKDQYGIVNVNNKCKDIKFAKVTGNCVTGKCSRQI